MADNNHIRPTKEELQENIRKSQEELENLNDVPEEVEEEEQGESTEQVVEEIGEDQEQEEESEDKDDDVPEEVEEEEQGESTEQKDIDWKKKHAESSKEAQILAAKEKKYKEAIDNANSLPDPTDQDLTVEYPEWEEMSTTEQRLAKENYINKRFRQELSKARDEEKNIEAWNQKVEEFSSDPKTLVDNPYLEGKIEEFKAFAMKPSRRTVDFETLVSAFIGEGYKSAKPKNKGKMFEQGTGGPNNKTQKKNDKISVEEGRRLMKTNYDEYKKLLKAGKISYI